MVSSLLWVQDQANTRTFNLSRLGDHLHEVLEDSLLHIW